jgi:hypothetical protein
MGVKWPGHGVDNTPHLAPRLHEEESCWLIFENVTPKKNTRTLKQYAICLQEFRKY